METILGQKVLDTLNSMNRDSLFNGDYVLESDRFLLRPISVGDVDHVWPHVSDSEIARYMSWEPHSDKGETKAFLERLENEMTKGKSITLAILMDNKFCGIISLISIIRKHRALVYDKAELAYWLASKCQKKGIMLEAGKHVIDLAFNKLGFHRLTVSHVTQNKASERLIKRWQFRYVGGEREAFMKDGEWFNHKLYELLKSDWNDLEGHVQ